MSTTNQKRILRSISNIIILVVNIIFFTACDNSGEVTSPNEESEELIGNWIKRSDFEGIARSDASIFIIEGKAYLFGGYNGIKRLNDFWEYDIENDSWTQKSDFPGVARNSAVAFSIANKGYIGTGFDGTNLLNDFWEFNPASNEWTQKADFAGSARYGAVAFALNNVGYVGTGYGTDYLMDFYKYDPNSDSWTADTGFKGSKRAFATTFVVDNKAYVVCGINNSSYLTDFWMFDPSTDSWTEKAKIANETAESFDDEYNIKRMCAVALVIDDKVYLSSGESGSLRSDTWEYNPVTDLWAEKTAFEGSSRSGAVGFSYNNRGFILTGRSSSYYFDDMYEFKPNENYYELD